MFEKIRAKTRKRVSDRGLTGFHTWCPTLVIHQGIVRSYFVIITIESSFFSHVKSNFLCPEPEVFYRHIMSSLDHYIIGTFTHKNHCFDHIYLIGIRTPKKWTKTKTISFYLIKPAHTISVVSTSCLHCSWRNIKIRAV